MFVVLKSQRNGLEIMLLGGTESTSDDAFAHGSSTFGLPHTHLGRVTLRIERIEVWANFLAPKMEWF